MTAYRIANNPGDYNSAHDLMKAEGFPSQKLSFPTVLAIDDGKTVGLLSTRIQNKMIVAGPLVLASDRMRVHTAIKLCELYEIALAAMGITTFLFHTEEGSTVDQFIERYSYMKPYQVDGKQKFFIRRIDDGRTDIGSPAQSGGEGASAKPS